MKILLLILALPAVALAQLDDPAWLATATKSEVAASGTAFVTTFGLTTTRNNAGNPVGFMFTVGASPITVTHIGRWVVAGNSQTHALKIVDAYGDTVPGCTVTVDTAGATAGQILYGALASPVELSANTVYYLLSAEINGGDAWHDSDTTTTTTAVATVNASAYQLDGIGQPSNNGTPNRSYVPVNFKYQ